MKGAGEPLGLASVGPRPKVGVEQGAHLCSSICCSRSRYRRSRSSCSCRSCSIRSCSNLSLSSRAFFRSSSFLSSSSFYSPPCQGSAGPQLVARPAPPHPTPIPDPGFCEFRGFQCGEHMGQALLLKGGTLGEEPEQPRGVKTGRSHPASRPGSGSAPWPAPRTARG